MNAKELRALIEKGLAEERRQHAALEEKKRGQLRGGSCGCKMELGCIGKCPRRALLRSLGIEEKHPVHKELMFKGGEVSELVIQKMLKMSGFQGHILVDSDMPVIWEVNGTQVTGRPDLGLDDVEGEFGIELKKICSTGSAVHRGIELDPEVAHLVQAAFYFSQRKCPGGYVLMYTSFEDFSVDGVWYLQKEIPEFHPLVEYCERYDRASKRKVTKAKKVYPFLSLFDLRFENGRLEYKHESADEWTSTIITIAGIEEFYRYVTECTASQQIPMKPADLKANGMPMPYALCDYCDFKAACEATDKWEPWLEACRRLGAAQEPKGE